MSCSKGMEPGGCSTLQAAVQVTGEPLFALLNSDI